LQLKTKIKDKEIKKMKFDVHISVSKIKKYATSASGDTVEVTERPQGGVSVVLADGQSSGKGAKWVSTFVVRKVITLLAEGVRDGAAARAASDSLFTERGGRVSAALNIISVDNQSKTMVITRNNPAPALLVDGNTQLLNEHVDPIGIYRGTRPNITEISLKTGITGIVYSDGLVHCGTRYGEKFDVVSYINDLTKTENISSKEIADCLLKYALKLDKGRPADDISIVVVKVEAPSGDEVRRMSVRLPLGN
jgi:serine phosphatase RsbU (regulator of sigma subunit)